MNYNCGICDKIRFKSKNILPKSFTHIQYEKYIRIYYIIENPKFFDINKKFIDYTTNHNRNFDSYIVK